MTRILIAGVPRAGKTTFGRQLAATLDVPLRSTDDLIATHGWSEASAEVAKWFGTEDSPADDSQIVEGVAVARALRKWLAAHPEGSPADAVVWMPDARVALSRGQLIMAKGVATVWAEVLPELRKRGTVVGTVEEIAVAMRQRVAS